MIVRGGLVAGRGGVTVWLGEHASWLGGVTAEREEHASWLGGVAAERGDDRDVETLCGVAASLPQS